MGYADGAERMSLTLEPFLAENGDITTVVRDVFLRPEDYLNAEDRIRPADPDYERNIPRLETEAERERAREFLRKHQAG